MPKSPSSSCSWTNVVVAIRSSARALVLATSLLAVAPMPALGAGPAVLPSPPRPDFMDALKEHLRLVKVRGLISQQAADEIAREFQGYKDRFPRVYEGPGFEYAIPTLQPLSAPYGPLMPPELVNTKSRPITEIIGREIIREEEMDELFRLMYAAKKEDGRYFEMFMEELFMTSIEFKAFQKPDGTVDKDAVSRAINRSRSIYAEWHTNLIAMSADGRLKRIVSAINNAIAYAQRNNLVFKPAQARQGIVEIAACLSAKGDGSIMFDTESCGFAMIWMGERAHADAATLQFYLPNSGGLGVKLLMARWDDAYASKAYGSIATDFPANANDAYWRDYFKLYVGTAKASQARLSNEEMGEILALERLVGRVAKLLRHFAEGGSFEGKKVSQPEIRAALVSMRKKKAEFEPTASPATRKRFEYIETMKGIEQVTQRAKSVGIE